MMTNLHIISFSIFQKNNIKSLHELFYVQERAFLPTRTSFFDIHLIRTLFGGNEITISVKREDTRIYLSQIFKNIYCNGIYYRGSVDLWNGVRNP